MRLLKLLCHDLLLSSLGLFGNSVSTDLEEIIDLLEPLNLLKAAFNFSELFELHFLGGNPPLGISHRLMPLGHGDSDSKSVSEHLMLFFNEIIVSLHLLL